MLIGISNLDSISNLDRRYGSEKTPEDRDRALIICASLCSELNEDSIVYASE
jgi:hypothetical protein